MGPAPGWRIFDGSGHFPFHHGPRPFFIESSNASSNRSTDPAQYDQAALRERYAARRPEQQSLLPRPDTRVRGC